MPELYGRPPKKTRPRRDAANVTPGPCAAGQRDKRDRLDKE